MGKYPDFLNWAVTRLGLQPTRNTQDVGYDGIGHFTVCIPKGTEKTEARVIAEVKIGKSTITSVRSFCHIMNRSEAQAGNLCHNRTGHGKYASGGGRYGEF